MKRQNVRTLALIVVTFTYLLVGAAIFDALESSYEETQKLEMDRLQDQYVRQFNITRHDFDEIYKLALKQKPIKAGTQWKFAGSFYFATTVITTIGYGHSTPKTQGGKIFCMIYALPGIPLTIVMFQSIGERMNMCLTLVLQWIKRFLMPNNGSGRISQTKLILLSSNFVTIVVGIGALIFSHYENWNLLDSIYYCLITLTTIGFGDLVALQKNDFIAKRPDYVAFSLIFILFGLTVVSSMMNLLVLRFLTMNTADERRDEIVAAVQAIDQDLQQQQQQLVSEHHIMDEATTAHHKQLYQSRNHLNNLMPNYYRVSSSSQHHHHHPHHHHYQPNNSPPTTTSSHENNMTGCGNCLCCLTLISRIRGHPNPLSWKTLLTGSHSDVMYGGQCDPQNGKFPGFGYHWQQWQKRRQKHQHYTIARGPAAHVRHLVESGGIHMPYLYDRHNSIATNSKWRSNNRYQCSMKYKSKSKQPIQPLPLIRVQQVTNSDGLSNDEDEEYYDFSSSVVKTSGGQTTSTVPIVTGAGGGCKGPTPPGYYTTGDIMSSSSQSDFDSIIFMSLASPSNRRKRYASL